MTSASALLLSLTASTGMSGDTSLCYSANPTTGSGVINKRSTPCGSIGCRPDRRRRPAPMQMKKVQVSDRGISLPGCGVALSACASLSSLSVASSSGTLDIWQPSVFQSLQESFGACTSFHRTQPRKMAKFDHGASGCLFKGIIRSCRTHSDGSHCLAAKIMPADASELMVFRCGLRMLCSSCSRAMASFRCAKAVYTTTSGASVARRTHCAFLSKRRALPVPWAGMLRWTEL